MLSTLALATVMQVSPQVQELVPGTDYDPSIPTLEEVVGHGFGEVVTPPDDVIRYIEALAEAAPDRTHLVQYAESWEGRPLVVLVIGSAERMARLEEVKAGLQRLSDPRGVSEEEAEALLAELPVVTALMHAIHGNEISPSGAAMAEAYHLLAARGNADVDLILSESLVLIDPLENPDGRNRFVYQNEVAQARWPDEAAYSAEHDEPWPGGRSNHYLFDLNRDLFIQSQPETRGKVDILLEYRPQIVADLHEMGGDAIYFFPPTAPPSNPWYGERQIALMDVFGSAIAARFDERGFAYFNREVFDLFYPGYVDMWPMGQGALGMTYEQASARALRLRRSDGDLLTYGQGVLQHFTAALETALTAARNRERIPARLSRLPARGRRRRADGPGRNRSALGPRPGNGGAARDDAGRERGRGLPRLGAGDGRRPHAVRRLELHRAAGPADARLHTQPPRPARADGGRFRAPADRASRQPAIGRDLRPDRLESVAPVGRGGDRDGRDRCAR